MQNRFTVKRLCKPFCVCCKRFAKSFYKGIINQNKSYQNSRTVNEVKKKMQIAEGLRFSSPNRCTPGSPPPGAPGVLHPSAAGSKSVFGRSDFPYIFVS